MAKMNSCDRHERDKRDNIALLALCQRTLDAWKVSQPGEVQPHDLQVELNNITVRRSAEDLGHQLS